MKPGQPKPGTDAAAAMHAFGIYSNRGAFDWGTIGDIGNRVLAGEGDGTVSEAWARVFVAWEEGEINETKQHAKEDDRDLPQTYVSSKANRAFDLIKAEIVRVLGEEAI